MTNKQHDLLNKAIELWGVDAQIEMIEEETLELSLAIHKFRRSKIYNCKDLHDRKKKVIDEIADVEIIIETAKKVFGYKQVENRRNFKFARLKQRIKNNSF